MQDGWRDNVRKPRGVRGAIAAVIGDDDERLEATLELVKRQNDY